MDYKIETQQILRETARKINIEDIKTALLLMAWNLEPSQAQNKPESHEKEPSNIKPLEVF